VIQFNINNAHYDDVIDNLPKDLLEMVENETLNAIKYGIQTNKSNVALFEINNSDQYISLSKDKWKMFLNKTLSKYVEKEDYNKCIEIRNLINLI